MFSVLESSVAEVKAKFTAVKAKENIAFSFGNRTEQGGRASSDQEIILDASEVRELPAPFTTNFCITDDQLGAGGSNAKFQKILQS